MNNKLSLASNFNRDTDSFIEESNFYIRAKVIENKIVIKHDIDFMEISEAKAESFIELLDRHFNSKEFLDYELEYIKIDSDEIYVSSVKEISNKFSFDIMKKDKVEFNFQTNKINSSNSNKSEAA